MKGESIHGDNAVPFKRCQYASTASSHTAVDGDPTFQSLKIQGPSSCLKRKIPLSTIRILFKVLE